MRLLHTMLRVGDLQRSIDFYTNVLGMKLLRTSENPEYKYSLAFVGYGPETEEAVIELTYNWGVDKYELGTAYGHIALSVDNAAEACEKIRQNGGNVTREAGWLRCRWHRGWVLVQCWDICWRGLRLARGGWGLLATSMRSSTFRNSAWYS